MKAISVRQPFAGFIADGDKKIEFRRWKTDYRGPLVIVASQRRPLEWYTYLGGNLYETIGQKGGEEVYEILTGCALAIVDLADIRPMTKADAKSESEPFDAEAYSWILKKPQELIPFPVKGRLRLYEIPDDAVNAARVRRARR
jgi:hypothetical protein